jgi:hypothetical protein
VKRREAPLLGLAGCVLIAASPFLPAFVERDGTASGLFRLERSLDLLVPAALFGVSVTLLLRWPALAAYAAGLWLCEVAFVCWMGVPFATGRSPWAWIAAITGGLCLLLDAVRRARRGRIRRSAREPASPIPPR